MVVNEGGHGFYRVRYDATCSGALVARLPSWRAIERFNLVNDAWAVTLAGLMPLTDYLDLTARFRDERDKNVWTILHRLAGHAEPPRRSGRTGPAWRRWSATASRRRLDDARLGRRGAGEDELTRQLRGDLIRALGTLGNDRAVQAQAAERYGAHVHGKSPVDPNVLPGPDRRARPRRRRRARYDEFVERFRSATTPQEEQRYLYALTAFPQPELIAQTLARTINGEIRTQDAPFVVRSLLMTVHGREPAWEFVKKQWDTMDRLYPKHGLRRMAEGVTGLITPELEPTFTASSRSGASSSAARCSSSTSSSCAWRWPCASARAPRWPPTSRGVASR